MYSESASNFECCTLPLNYKPMKQSLELLGLEAFAAKEFTDIFWSIQPRQNVLVVW
jgi:hypothetical protein